jgi:hypothetical protein
VAVVVEQLLMMGVEEEGVGEWVLKRVVVVEEAGDHLSTRERMRLH